MTTVIWQRQLLSSTVILTRDIGFPSKQSRISVQGLCHYYFSKRCVIFWKIKTTIPDAENAWGEKQNILAQYTHWPNDIHIEQPDVDIELSWRNWQPVCRKADWPMTMDNDGLTAIYIRSGLVTELEDPVMEPSGAWFTRHPGTADILVEHLYKLHWLPIMGNQLLSLFRGP